MFGLKEACTNVSENFRLGTRRAEAGRRGGGGRGDGGAVGAGVGRKGGNLIN